MNFYVTMKNHDILLTISKEEIDDQIKNHLTYGSVQFADYVYDEAGNMCGIRCFADLGHGYGFDNGHQEFILGFDEAYSFTHDYTSIEGPSDWEDGSFKVVLNLIKSDD